MKKSFLLFTTLIASIVISKNLENSGGGSVSEMVIIMPDKISKENDRFSEFSRTERESKTYVPHNGTANNGYDSLISKSPVLDTVNERQGALITVDQQKF